LQGFERIAGGGHGAGFDAAAGAHEQHLASAAPDHLVGDGDAGKR
jgi:hypothetical protein